MCFSFSLGSRDFEFRELRRGWLGGRYTRLPEDGSVCFSPTNAFSDKMALYNAEFSAKSKDWRRDPGFSFALDFLRTTKGHLALLDVGCSIGKLAFALKDSGLWANVQYVGVDRRGAPVDLARRLHPDAEFTLMDAEDGADGLKGMFDVVVAKGMLCNTSNPYRALAWIESCTRDRMMLLHMPLSSVAVGAKGFVPTLFSSPSSAYLFTVMEVAALQYWLVEHGFEVIAQRRRPGRGWVENYGPFHLHDMVVARC